MRRYAGVFILCAILAGALIAAAGKLDRSADFDSVAEMWGDVLRDADQVGYRFTRVSPAEEMAEGRIIAAAYAPAADASPWSAYVRDIGAHLAQHVQRTGIQYEFKVLNLPEANAFALPGGHVYITDGLLNLLHSEAEVASVLGHEVSHVDLRHCIERFQYEMAARRIGLGDVGAVADFVHQIYALPYSKYQEEDADVEGMRIAADAGHDPNGAVRAFQALAAMAPAQARRSPQNPVDETAGAAARSLENFFRSHPRSEDRQARLARLVDSERSRLHGNTFYIGRKNHQEKVSHWAEAYADEEIQY